MTARGMAGRACSWTVSAHLESTSTCAGLLQVTYQRNSPQPSAPESLVTGQECSVEGEFGFDRLVDVVGVAQSVALVGKGELGDGGAVPA